MALVPTTKLNNGFSLFSHHSSPPSATSQSHLLPPPCLRRSSLLHTSRDAARFPVRRFKRDPKSATRAMLHQDQVLSDTMAAGLSLAVALSVHRMWVETANRGIFDQTINRKLVHISIGLVFMLCWPLFSSGHRGAIMAALIPGANIIRLMLIGSGLWKDEATVKSMSRFGDHRELLKGPLYYVTTISLACAIFWRTSPVAIAAICNLCAGDGMADIVGRRFGKQKLPYNRNKSVAGSIAMALSGFLASLAYMHYFASFGVHGGELGDGARVPSCLCRFSHCRIAPHKHRAR